MPGVAKLDPDKYLGEIKGINIAALSNDGKYLYAADGDLGVVRRQDAADDGDIVAALLDDEATVKRFYRENGHIRLQPANPSMEPIIADEVRILGKVTLAIRRL